MIAAKVENWKRYFEGPVWEKAFEHIRALGPESEEGITELMGKDMFARVMSYDTVEPAGSKVEAHRDYIDIQCSLANGERIEWFPLEGLKPVNEYNPEKDVINFQRPDFAPLSVCVEPGMFAVFYPEDAHMPKLIISKALRMKKVVVKVRLGLLGNGR